MITDQDRVSPKKVIHDIKKKKTKSRCKRSKKDVVKGMDFISEASDVEEVHSKVAQEIVEVSDTEEPSRIPHNPLVCYFPNLSGDRRSYNLSDYKSLRPFRFLTDVTVDFAFCIENYYEISKDVFLLSTELAQIFSGGNWWNDPRLINYIEDAKLWDPEGVKLVLLPLCYSSHFYVLAAILDPENPLLVILESIGSYYSNEPPVVKVFETFLMEKKQLLGHDQTKFKKVTPEVPRQKQGSNDCGLFAITFMKKIRSQPDDFIRRVKNSSLADWFPSDEVDSLRYELANQLSQLAQNQRLPGHELDGDLLSLPVINFLFNS